VRKSGIQARQVLWRYMDFPRFVAMLEYGGLFFSKSEKMEDGLEGALSRPTRKNLERLHAELRRCGVDRNFSGREIVQTLRRCISISSWHANEHESAAMWKLYAASEQAIAIRTSYRQLHLALSSSKSIALVAPVRYISYQNDNVLFDSIYAPFLYKERSFEFENECRGLIADMEILKSRNPAAAATMGEGAWVKVDLEALVNGIFIAPDAERWYCDLVKRVSKHYGLIKPVEQSRFAVHRRRKI